MIGSKSLRRSKSLSQDFCPVFTTIIDDIKNDNYTDEQMKRLKAHKRERKRQKNQLEKQDIEVRDRRKRIELNRRFEHLNDVLKKVRVLGPLRGVEGGQIMEFDLTLKRDGHSFTP